MARHGENIRKRTDGRWEGRYKVFDTSKGDYIYRSVYGGTYDVTKEKLARAKLNITDVAIEESQTGKESHIVILFSQAAQEWLVDIANRRKYSTYVKYAMIYQTHLAKAVGSCMLSDTMVSQIQTKIFEHLATTGFSQSLQKSIFCIANQILNFAKKRYLLNISLLGKPDIKPKNRPVKTFSKAEQARLLSDIYEEPNSFKIALLLCLHTGLRLGELCALKWTDLDLKDMSLTVNRTVQRIAIPAGATRTVLLETEPKSEDSKRTIPLTTEIARFLVRQQNSQPYIFGGEKPLEPRTMQYRFKKLLRQTEIDDRNFHVLRHTFATNCIENGMDVKALSEILGHSDIKITLNRYVHPTMDSKRKQIGQLTDFYGQILGHVS